MTLAEDATIQTVVGTLSKPLDYVCGVLANLHKCQKAHKNASVCIGTMGAGLKPYYRVTFDTPDGTREVFDTFFDNHVSFSVEGRTTTGGVRWSNSLMSLDEVAKLRGTLKG